MMNRIYFIVLGVCLLSSCSFLDEAPVTSIGEDDAYVSESALEAGIAGCYRAMQGSALYQGEMSEYLQFCSMLVHWKSERLQQQWTQCFDLTMYSVSNNNQKIYRALYSGVNTCNRLISGLSGSPVDDFFKTRIEAEARLIRAVLYFTLVRLYGDVPLLLEPVAYDSGMGFPRTAYYDVYEQIVRDLRFAQDNMCGPKEQTPAAVLAGRPHKWAATSFLAAVYMQIACLLENADYQWFDMSKEGRRPDFTTCEILDAEDAWTLALEAAEDVIESEAYGLERDYRHLFRWDPVNHPLDYCSKERIFVLQSTDNGTSGNYMAVRTLPAYPGGTQNKTTENKNNGRIRPERYVFQKWAGTYGGELAPSDRDDIEGNLYISCPDPRFDATFIHTRYRNLNTGKNVGLYPAMNYVMNFNSREPYFRKYLSPLYDAGNGYADLYMMRYADVLLMAAEASASLSSGPGDTYWNAALDYVGQIHSRARASVDEGENPASQPTWEDRQFADKDALVKAIMWERVYEMSCEGHEFFDTHRRGAKYLVDEITRPLNAFLAEPNQSTVPDGAQDKTYKSVLFNGRTLPEDVEQVRKGLLLAFPDDEIRYNPALTLADQNDFYVL